MKYNTNSFKQPWFIRKIIYYVSAIIFLILAALGIISEEQGEQFLTTLNSEIVPIIASIIVALAGSKAVDPTHFQVRPSSELRESIQDGNTYYVNNGENSTRENLEKSAEAGALKDEDAVTLPVYKSETIN